jgi:GT2 family glycosyltransferase
VRPPREVIVVDNAPATTATRDVLRDHPGMRYVLEPRPGLSAARNAGIARATGDIIAFTDDDVVVHPEWTARLESAFDAPEVAAVTGLVLPAELRTEAQWTFEKDMGGFSQGYRELRFDERFFRATRRYGAWVWKVGAGASMAFRRHVFEELGAFDERLGAGASGCSEDSEMWYRVIARGWVCRYDPRVVVYHYHRDTLQNLSRQMHDYMRGHVTALFVQLQRHRHGGNLYRVLVTLPWHYFKMGLLEVLHGFRPRHATLLAEVRGCVAGIGYFLRHPRIPPRRSIEGEP